eukprot:jgi/Ulvmu1/6816/UM031_0020.1
MCANPSQTTQAPAPPPPPPPLIPHGRVFASIPVAAWCMLSYQRHCDAVAQLHMLSSRVADVAVSSVAADRESLPRQADGRATERAARVHMRFLDAVVHAASLLHAVGLAALRRDLDMENLYPHDSLAPAPPAHIPLRHADGPGDAARSARPSRGSATERRGSGGGSLADWARCVLCLRRSTAARGAHSGPGGAAADQDPRKQRGFLSRARAWTGAILGCLVLRSGAERERKINRLLPLPVIGGFTQDEGVALGANLTSGTCSHTLNVEEALHGILLSNGCYAPAPTERVHVVHAWLQQLLLQRIAAGGLAAPAALQARLCSCASEAMLAFEQCRRLATTPLPFALAQTVSGLVLLLVLSAPFHMAASFHSTAAAAVASALVVLAYVIVNEVATELEEPFSHNPNQLPLARLQYRLNERLLSVTRTTRPVAFTDCAGIVGPNNLPSMPHWFPEDDDEARPPGAPATVSATQPAGAGLAVRPYASHHDMSAADRERQLLWKTRWHAAQRTGFWRAPSGLSGSIASHEALANLPELWLAPSVRTDPNGAHAPGSEPDLAEASPQSVAIDVARGTIDSAAAQDAAMRAARRDHAEDGSPMRAAQNVQEWLLQPQRSVGDVRGSAAAASYGHYATFTTSASAASGHPAASPPSPHEESKPMSTVRMSESARMDLMHSTDVRPLLPLSGEAQDEAEAGAGEDSAHTPALSMSDADAASASHSATLALGVTSQASGQFAAQGYGRYAAGAGSSNGAFGSFVSGAAPCSASPPAKTLHTISESRPAYSTVREASYYTERRQSTAALPQSGVCMPSKRISSGVFATSAVATAQHVPAHLQAGPRPPAITTTNALIRAATQLAAEDDAQASPRRPTVAAAVTAALVASALAASSTPSASHLAGASGGQSMHGTPPVEGPQHVYESDGGSMATSSSMAPHGGPGGAADKSGSDGQGAGSSAASGTTRSGTAGATYDPQSDARKEQRMVELAALLARRPQGVPQAAPSDGGHPPSRLPTLSRQLRARPLDPRSEAYAFGLHADVAESLYHNIDIPKPTSSSYEERSMERSVDSMFRDGSPPWLTGADIGSTCSTAHRNSMSSPPAARPRRRQNVSSIGGLRRHRAVPTHGGIKSAAAAYGTPRRDTPPHASPADSTPSPPPDEPAVP